MFRQSTHRFAFVIFVLILQATLSNSHRGFRYRSSLSRKLSSRLSTTRRRVTLPSSSTIRKHYNFDTIKGFYLPSSSSVIPKETALSKRGRDDVAWLKSVRNDNVKKKTPSESSRKRKYGSSRRKSGLSRRGPASSPRTNGNPERSPGNKYGSDKSASSPRKNEKSDKEIVSSAESDKSDRPGSTGRSSQRKNEKSDRSSDSNGKNSSKKNDEFGDFDSFLDLDLQDTDGSDYYYDSSSSKKSHINAYGQDTSEGDYGGLSDSKGKSSSLESFSLKNILLIAGGSVGGLIILCLIGIAIKCLCLSKSDKEKLKQEFMVIRQDVISGTIKNKLGEASLSSSSDSDDE